jgi:hypothetical protein
MTNGRVVCAVVAISREPRSEGEWAFEGAVNAERAGCAPSAYQPRVAEMDRQHKGLEF